MPTTSPAAARSSLPAPSGITAQTYGIAQGAFTLSGTLGGNLNLEVLAGSLTTSGPVGGNVGVVLLGGNLTMAGSNSYSGGTTITAGTLTFTGTNNNISGNWSISSAGTLIQQVSYGSSTTSGLGGGAIALNAPGPALPFATAGTGSTASYNNTCTNAFTIGPGGGTVMTSVANRGTTITTSPYIFG